MAGARRLEVIISGNAAGALKSFAELDVAAETSGSKMSKLGPIAAAAGIAIAAGVVGAGIALFKIGENFDEAYDKIRVGTGATGDVLDGLKDDFKAVVSEVPASFGDASDAIAKIAQVTGQQGPPLQGLTEQFLELSRITKTDLTANLDAGLAALQNWQVPAEQQAGVMDELFRASQLSGVSFETLSKQLVDGGLVFRGLGFDMGQATTVLAGLGKAGIDVGDVMPALSKAMATAAKEGKSAQDVYQGTIAAIKAAPDATAAAGIAMDVFGAKAGPKFAELVRSGQFAFDDLGESIAEGTDTIIGAGKDTQDFGEKWELLKNRVFVALEPIAMKVFNAIGDGMDALGPKVQQLSAWFSDNLPGALAAVQPWFDKLVMVVTAFGSVLINQVAPAIAATIGFLADHQEILQGAAVVIGGVLVAAFVAWAVSAATAAAATVIAAAPVILLVAGLALLAAGVIWVVQNFDIFSGAAVAAFDAVVGAVSSVISWVSANWPLLLAILTGPFGLAVLAIATYWDEIVGFVQSVPGRIAAAAVGMWDGIFEAFKSAINAIVGAWNGLRIPGFDLNITMPSAIPNIEFSWGGIDLPDIPYLAKGGVVTKPTLAMIGEAGREAVVPLDRAGDLGGNTYNYFTINAGMGTDATAVGRQIIGLLEKATATGVRPGVKTLAAFRS